MKRGTPRHRNVAGQRFGRLVALERVGTRNKAALWRCVCDCGREHNVVASKLFDGVTQSCGCLRQEAVTKHGATRGYRPTPEYKAWLGLRERTTNPANKAWRDYGGRGITVCERWRNSFEAFRLDMGPRPSPGHSIDRINNDGNYEPGNCRWATRAEQNKNQRPKRPHSPEAIARRLQRNHERRLARAAGEP